MKKTFTKNLMMAFAAIFAFNMATAQTAFYTEDFTADGLPTGWTTDDASTNDTMWDWCGDPSEGNPCIPNWTTYNGQHDGVFTSTSGGGHVFFDSDILATLPANHVAQLTSSPINCSGQPEVWAKFESLLGVWATATMDNAILEVSIDGTNWTPFNIFDIAPGMSGNVPGTTRWTFNPGYAFIDISSVASNQPSVTLRWSWTGNYEYYWLLDDVELYDADPTTLFIPANDLTVNDFFAIAPNAYTPASQIEQFGFLADVRNSGSTTQNNVNLNVQIVDNATSAVLLTEDLAYGSIDPFVTVENQVFAGAGFTPEATVGKSYTGTYTISADSMDADILDNTRTFDFFVSDTLFAKENGPTRNVTPGDGNWTDATQPHNWGYGNNFYMPNGEGLNARYATFMVGNPAEMHERFFTINLYRWDEDTNGDLNLDPDERTVIGTHLYFLDSTQVTSDDMITVPLLAPGATEVGPIPLSNNTNYVLMIEYETNDVVNFTARVSDDYQYGAHDLRTDSLMASKRTEFTSFSNGPLAIEAIESNGFGFAPVLRLSVGEALEFVSVKDILTDDNKISVSPNPANSYIELNLDLVENHSDAIVRIIDITGKVVSERFYDNVQKETFNYNVSDLATGSYYIHFVSNIGNKTVPFIVTK